MKPKKKPCKECSELTYYRKYGMCYGCYGEWLLNSEEGQEKLRKATLKATADRRAIEKGIQEKKDRKKLGGLLANVRNIVHEYIRLRDKGKPCISCGIPYKSDFQAGHFYKAELYSTLKFNEFNIHGQCQLCNLRKEGNLNEYDQNLPNRIGQDAYELLKEKAEEDKRTDHKWDREELNNIREYYKEKIKNLQNSKT